MVEQKLNTNLPGTLITLEGIDGCGKSTQAEYLIKRLQTNAINYLHVREPGGTGIGEAVRQILLDPGSSMSLQTEMLLYMAARSELTGQVILPALKKGLVVLCDRFTDSTAAYQGYGGGLELGWIAQLNLKATSGLKPDLTFLFDLPVEEAIKRRGDKADRLESRNINYHQRVRRGYLELSQQEPQRFVVIDATGAQSQIHEAVWAAVVSFIAQEKG